MAKTTMRAMLTIAIFLTALPIYADTYTMEKGFAQEEISSARRDPNWYTIDTASARFTRVGISPNKRDISYLRTDKNLVAVQNAIVLIDQVINIACKVWDIIIRNAAAVEINTSFATAVPQGINAWTQLSQWQQPKSVTYVFTVNNLYGARVVDVEYDVVYTYGGRFQGKGQYLTGVTIVPTKVNVAWGYRFGINVTIPDSTIANIGTHEDPIAALQVHASYRVATSLQQYNGASIYYITGTGDFSELTAKALKLEDIGSAKGLSEPEKVFEQKK